MSLVLDCSVTLSWYLTDERDELSAMIEDQVTENGGVVPFHHRMEMANGLVVALRRNRIEQGFIARAFAQFDSLAISVDRDGMNVIDTATFDLARNHGLTVYDAIYLETALRLSLPLATYDKALHRAAQVVGVPAFALGQT